MSGDECSRCEELEDDLLTVLKVRNEALRIAAEYAHPGPDGQDYLDRSHLIRRWLEEAYEELDLDLGEPLWTPVVEPKRSLVAWTEDPHLPLDTAVVLGDRKHSALAYCRGFIPAPVQMHGEVVCVRCAWPEKSHPAPPSGGGSTQEETR